MGTCSVWIETKMVKLAKTNNRFHWAILDIERHVKKPEVVASDTGNTLKMGQ